MITAVSKIEPSLCDTSPLEAIIWRIGLSCIQGKHHIISLSYADAQELDELGLLTRELALPIIRAKLIAMGDETYQELMVKRQMLDPGNPPACTHMLAFALIHEAFPSTALVLKTIGMSSVEEVLEVCCVPCEEMNTLDMIFFNKLVEAVEHHMAHGPRKRV
jgi:hypothetical protein